MKKIFKTNVDDFEIIDLMTNYFTDMHLKIIIDDNPMLKFSCNAKGVKKFRFNRTIVTEKVKEFSKKDRVTRNSILKTWNVLTKVKIKEIDLLPQEIDVFEKLSKGRKTQDIFEACTILWQKANPELNKCGDKLYDLYNNKVDQLKDYNNELENSIDENMEEKDMNKDIMSLSIGECIQALSNAKDEINELNQKLEEKQEEIDKYKTNLDSIIDNRDLKKEIKLLSRKISEIEPQIKGENEKLKVEICELKNQNIELRKRLDGIDKTLSGINVNTIIKALSENQNNINNSLKGTLMESIQKNMDNLAAGLESKVLAILNEKQEEINKAKDVSPQKNNNLDKEDDFNTLIEAMLLDNK